MKTNNDLRKEIRRGIHQDIQVFLIAGFSCVCRALLVDLLKKAGVAVNRTAEAQMRISSFIGGIKQSLLNDMNKYCDLVMTFDTILAAAVIFFYSIQDSRKGGIPHRTILSYTLGAFTVPVLFVVTLLALPFCYIAQSLNLNRTVYVSLLFTYIIQMMIIVFILASTSYQYSVYAITNVEIRQFKAMSGQEAGRGADVPGEDSGKKWGKAEENPFFTWTYLQHHLEQITLSDELMADKLLVTRRILRVPYYEREILLREEVLGSLCKHGLGLHMSVKKLATVNLKRNYEFYYGNLLAVLKYINQPRDSELRDKIYLILYEFMEELTELYESKEITERTIENYRNNYLMTIAGIINAVLSSDVEEAETFCNYVLNHIVSKDTWSEQVGLYIVYRKYLYEKDIDLRRHTKINLEHIDNICKWIDTMGDIQDIYILFWEIWMEFTTISRKDSYRYLYEAMKMLQGERNGTDPITYNILAIRLSEQKGRARCGLE